MRDVIFHRLAAKELLAAAKWYVERSTEARWRFRDAVVDTVERIAASPDSHAILAEPYRCARAGRFPYLLIFEARPDRSIFIIAVAHASRRPGYWRRRK